MGRGQKNPGLLGIYSPLFFSGASEGPDFKGLARQEVTADNLFLFVGNLDHFLGLPKIIPSFFIADEGGQEVAVKSFHLSRLLNR